MNILKNYPGNERLHLDPEKCACFFCGSKNSAAMWMGVESGLFVCRRCAVDKLPRLIADAVFLLGSEGVIAKARAAMDKIQCSYWEAMACRLAFEEGLKPVKTQKKEQ